MQIFASILRQTMFHGQSLASPLPQIAPLATSINAPAAKRAAMPATALSAGTGLPAGVTFDGFGRAPAVNGGTDIARVDVTNAISANARRMVILVSAGGQTRMCDPGVLLAHNPQGCQ
jgi:hypothetical protein